MASKKPTLAKLKAPVQSAGAVPLPAPSKAAKLAPQQRLCSACEGQRDATGKWIHSARCPRTIFLYFGSGFRPGDWTSPVYRCCPYQCPGVQLPSGMTHTWDCSFWDSTDATPFDNESVNK